MIGTATVPKTICTRGRAVNTVSFALVGNGSDLRKHEELSCQ